MLINGIEFPEKILKAINEDNLVIFAGAGVSKGAPSNLPDFKGLAEEIGRQCGRVYCYKKDDIDEIVEIDEFLGDLERDYNTDVKRKVSEVLSNNAKPNDFHKTILNLFQTPEAIRIVTTNQDELFEAALKKLRMKGVNIFSAPAIPYGDDFSGIVHLHGKVSDPDNIVITDSDFGKAYMLKGYASTFLVSLFQKYTVLFVGYSYNDRIVRYLTSAITKENIKNAFILCKKATQKQQRTNIMPIPYGEKKHEVLYEAFKQIGKYTKRGVLDWQQRIISLNVDNPPIDDETRDELLDGIKQLSVQKNLCSAIKGKEWPEWFDQYGIFDDLFDNKKDLSESGLLWADWLAKNYFDDKLLRLIEKHCDIINPQFCNIVICKFKKNDKRYTDELFGLYVSVFFENISNGFYLQNIIDISNERELTDIKWAAFWKMIDFQIILEPPFLHQIDTHRIVHKWKVTDYYLVEMFWEKEKTKQLMNPRSVFMNCLSIIENLYNRLSLFSKQKPIYSLDCLDIEKNEEDHFSTNVELIICEILEKSFVDMYLNNPKLSSLLAYDLVNSKEVLIRRLGLLLIRKYINNEYEEKIRVLLNQFTLHEFEEHEQIFKLVAECFDHIDDTSRHQIIKKIWDFNFEGIVFKSDEERDRWVYYKKYNWLIWLKEKCTHSDDILGKLKIINEKYPDFKPRERPDLSTNISVTSWVSESPISNDDLKKLSIKDACDYLIDFKTDFSVIGPDRFGLMKVVNDVCQSDISWGISLIEELKTRNYWNDDLWQHIFDGMSKGIEKTRDFTKVINCLDDKVIENCGLNIAHFVHDSISKEFFSREISDHLTKNLVRLVKKIWLYRKECTDNEIEKNDNTCCSITTTNELTNILMKLLLLNTNEQSIPTWLDSIVKNNIENSDNIIDYIYVISGYAAHLFYRDPEWTKEHVLHYLSSTNKFEKKAAWSGFLSRVSNFSVVFGKELLPIFKNNIGILNDLNDNLRRQLIEVYTLLMVFMTDDPRIEYLAPFLQNGSESDRKNFAHAISYYLKNMKNDIKTNLWKRWLKEYWNNRNMNIPRELDNGEYSEMLCWLLEIPDYDEAVELALKTRKKIKSPSRFLYELVDADIIEKYPEKTAQLIIHLIQNSDEKIIDSKIKELIKKLKSQKISKQTKEELENIINMYL